MINKLQQRTHQPQPSYLGLMCIVM